MQHTSFTTYLNGPENRFHKVFLGHPFIHFYKYNQQVKFFKGNYLFRDQI